ncbi:DNA polymerase III subunit gamma/tau [Zhongshania aliphaticivorans]|uniref:DNA polymerase III subunit gamma/tau n=1 Tax=Zhongshania aliphaticivorans TaxID=1470434 RepID=UPI0012E59FFE|nr:DNA polymerase III subunit gamma/tau [Zhongshania aliphaticivorans]CAA0108088.1 DNA polymerase III subunit tau [Zhongshania aliphaticivorans]
MSYQVLARKWRPKTFREMAGQNHVLKALVNALDHDRLHHAYLFTGTRGVGKTTIARILAKCLNCQVGVSSEPCGQCNACVAINEGRFVDLLEVDAASRTKVEDTREILDNVQYMPSQGRYKVYLIDEVHMLSSSSFNALLKTLEEPPAHVKFLLATTDPQKLPATILSRCLQFNLKNLSPERIVDYLKTVLEQEMVQYDESSLWLLGRAADGSMRDALSLTDQAIAFGSGRLGEADVRQMLGTIDHNSVYRLIEALAVSDGAALLGVVADLAEMGADFAGVVSELLVVMHRLAVAQTVPEGLDNSLGDRNKIIELASKLAAEDVQFYYQIALAGRRDMGLAPDPRAGLEMLLLRMLAFKPQGIIDAPRQSLARPVAAVAEATASVKKPQTHKPAADTSLANELISDASTSTMAAPKQVLPKSNDDQKISDDTEARTLVDTIDTQALLSQQELAPQAPLASQEESVTSIAAAPLSEPDLSGGASETISPANEILTSPQNEPDVEQPALVAATALVLSGEKIAFSDLNDRLWREQFDAFQLPGMLGSVASHCQIATLAADSLSFNIDEANAALLNDRHIERLGELLSEYFEKSLKVTVNIGAVAFETPAAYKQRCLDERLAIAKQALRTDSYVARIIQEFDGVLDEESVRLVD